MTPGQNDIGHDNLGSGCDDKHGKEKKEIEDLTQAGNERAPVENRRPSSGG